MTTATLIDAKQITAIQTRYQFWKKKESEAMDKGDTDGFETATNAILKLEKDAKEAGVELAAPEGTDPVGTTTNANQGRKVAEKSTRPTVPSPKPKSVKGAEQVAARAKELAEKKAAKAASGGASVGKDGQPKAPRVKKAKELRECLDGCGTMVAGNFKMGHDAKLKSLIQKVERGEAEQADIPEIAQDLITFKKGEVETVKDREGNVKSKVQTYVVTKAPVRFPGRPEVQLTERG